MELEPVFMNFLFMHNQGEKLYVTTVSEQQLFLEFNELPNKTMDKSTEQQDQETLNQNIAGIYIVFS